MLFSDDDAFIHPYRLLSDLAEHRATRRYVYGQIGWAAGWDPKQFSHFGYGNTGPEVHLWSNSPRPACPTRTVYAARLALCTPHASHATRLIRCSVDCTKNTLTKLQNKGPTPTRTAAQLVQQTVWLLISTSLQ